MSRPTDLDRLLAEDAWARRLARALARGAEDPDDLVQEAYTRAFAHGALPVTHVRGWFARVLRNLTVERRRARGARSQREAAHARARAGAAGDTPAGPRDGELTPDELAARAEVQERLAAAVLTLPSRQRDVILLRHFDGAELADIARRLGLAPSTVQEHLARAHAELRRKLASWADDTRWSHGFALLLTGREAMPGALTIAAAATPSLVTAALVPSSPFLIAMTLSKVSLGVALAVALSVLLWRSTESPELDDVDSARSITNASSRPGPAPDSSTHAAEQSDSEHAAIGSAVRREAAIVDSKGTVDVSVVDIRGVPVEGADVSVELTPEERRANRIEVSGFDMWQTPPGMSGTTDARGATRLIVPAGRPLRIGASKRARPPAEGVPSSAESVDVESLLPGASTSVTIRLRRQPDVEAELQIVDAVTGAPIAGAQVFMESKDSSRFSTGERATLLPPQRDADGTSDAAGLVHVVGYGWLDTWCLVMATGHGPRMQPLWPANGAHTAITGPIVVELERSCSIEVLVHAAPQGAEVRARLAVTALRQRALVPAAQWLRFGASPYELRAAPDDEGRFRFVDVPSSAKVSLTLHALVTGDLLYAAAEAVETRAGETHRVTWDLAASGRFVCTVHEVDGSPASGRVVQLSLPSGRVIGTTDRGEKPLKSARTDAAGVAVFTDVAPGTWVVGLAHAERGRGDWPRAPERESPERDFARYELEVEMPAGGGEVPVAFTLHRGLYIEGRVVAPHALPKNLAVSASAGTFHAMVQGIEIIEGQFRLGPLMPGDYRVGARVMGRSDHSFAPSDVVEVVAGTTDVELALRLGVQIELRAVDARLGDAADAKFIVSRIDGGAYHSSYEARASFNANGLERGVYCAVALAPDGRVGVVDRFTAESSTELTEVTVPIDVGGTLVVEGPDRDGIWDVYVSRGEGVLALHRLERSERESSVLPPGRYRVGVVARQRGEGQPAWVDRFDAEHVVEVRAGEETVLTLSP